MNKNLIVVEDVKEQVRVSDVIVHLNQPVAPS